MSVTDPLWSRCFLCSSQIPSCLDKSASKRRRFNQIHKILLKYLLSDSQNLNVPLYIQVLQLVTDNVGNEKGNVTFCSDCDDLADSVAELQLQLEVVQMKLVEKLKTAKRAVKNCKESLQGKKMFEMCEANVRRRGLKGEKCEWEKKFLEVLTQVHQFVIENEGSGGNIPLLFMEKFQPTPFVHAAHTSKTPPTFPPDTTKSYRVVVDSSYGENSEKEVEDEVKPEVDNFDAEPGDAQVRRVNFELTTDSSYSPRHEDDNNISDEENDNDTQLDESLVAVPGKRKRTAALRASKRIETITKMLQASSSKSFAPPTSSGKKSSVEKSPKTITSSRSTTLKKRVPRIGPPVRSLRYKCDVCSYETTEVCKIEYHLKEHETQEKSYECEDCQLKFTQEQTLKIHLIRHRSHWRCDICSEMVVQAEMVNHLKSHKSKIFNCNYCDHPFGNFLTLWYHTVSHPYSKLICGECPEAEAKEFRVRHDLPRHLYEKHGHKELKLSCPNCKLVFFDRSYLSNHQKHHGRHTCDPCKKSFLNIATLASHKIVEHGFPKYKCEFCPEKEWTNINSKRLHMAVHHGVGKVNKFQCSICPKHFPTKGGLKSHELTHGNEKPYTCELCGFSTNNLGTLHHHLIRHTGNKQYSCSYCSEKFYEKWNLDRHVRIHTKETPYQCEKCGKGFRSNSSLSKHRRKVNCLQPKKRSYVKLGKPEMENESDEEEETHLKDVSETQDDIVNSESLLEFSKVVVNEVEIE